MRAWRILSPPSPNDTFALNRRRETGMLKTTSMIVPNARTALVIGRTAMNSPSALVAARD
jgi:hypothetical protein